jgi:hypothetical protein
VPRQALAAGERIDFLVIEGPAPIPPESIHTIRV